ncbi:sulfite exporter TauE/SafE family protein [candidate division KSB1 bacterium]
MVLLIILVLGGVLAGIIGGMLGIGGGILLMPILRFIVGLSPAYAAGTCIVAVFFTTLGGSFKHYKQGHVNVRSIIPVIVAGALSTFVFSLVFLYFTKKGKWLDLGTGLVFSLVSIRMIIEGFLDLLWKKVKEAKTSEIQGLLLEKVTIGGFAGILPGLFGIGTGAILVPAFTFILKAPIKIAIGSSLACFSVNAFLSSILKFFQGFISIEVMLPLCLGTLIGSNMGAILNKYSPTPVLKIMFGSVFTYIALKYILLFFEG